MDAGEVVEAGVGRVEVAVICSTHRPTSAAALATRWSRVRFPAASASTEMGDRLGTGKPPRCFTKPPRPTQPPTLSGTGNEYQPKCSAAGE